MSESTLSRVLTATSTRDVWVTLRNRLLCTVKESITREKCAGSSSSREVENEGQKVPKEDIP